MQKKKLIYKPQVTIYDKVNKHTAVKDEVCIFVGIEINGDSALAIVVNTQDNKLLIPLHVFEEYFDAFQIEE